MKYIKFLFGMYAIFLFTPVASAQEMVVVADVSIQNASIVLQEDNALTVFFEFVNGEMVQHDVQYGLQLVREDETSQLMDAYIVKEGLRLSPNEQRGVDITYEAPKWLNGEYTAYVVSSTSKGVPLAGVPAGKVTFSGSGEYLNILQDSCGLYVDGVLMEPTNETLLRESQEAVFNCTIENIFSTPVTVTTLTLAYEDSVYGNGVGAFPAETISFEANETKEVSFSVPRHSGSGAYAHLVMLEHEGAIVSTPVYYSYSTTNTPAQIINVSTDKVSYEEGDEIVITTSVFLQQDATLSLDVLSDTGRKCTETLHTAMEKGQIQSVVSTVSSRNCMNAQVTASFSGEGEQLLAQETYGDVSVVKDETNKPLVVFATIVLLAILLIGIMIMRRTSKNPSSLTLGMMFVLFVSSFGLLGAHEVEAKTWSGQYGQCNLHMEGDLDKSSYTVGSTIKAGGYAAAGCAHGSGAAGGGPLAIYVSTPGSSGTITPVRDSSGYWRAGPDASLQAPSSNGSYNVRYQISWGDLVGYIGYTVTGATPPPAPNATLNASPSTIDSGDNSTLSWTCTNSTSARIGGTGSVSTSGSMPKSPTSSTTYTLTCTGPGGSDSDTARITVNQPTPAPTATFNANPTTVVRGSQTRLQWGSTNATSCTGWEFATNGNPSGTKYVTVWSNTTYGVTCSGPGGTATASQYVRVTDPAPSAPTATLTANPGTITQGQGGSTLSWSSSNATSCSGSGSGFSTGNATSGSDGVNPSSTTTYSVTCSGPGGSDTDTATVTVNVPAPSAPTANLTVDDNSLTRGESTILRWSSSNATSCSGSGSGFSTGNATSGNDGISPTSSTTYTVTCTGPGGSASDSVSVSVSSPPSPPSATLDVRNETQGGGWTGNNITIIAGDQIALRWSSSNASSCNGSNFSTGGNSSGQTGLVTEPSPGTDTVYSVSCSGASDSLRVTALGSTPELSSNKSQVRQGESVTLSYNMQGNSPAQCTLVGPGVSYLAGSFSGQTGSLAVSISGDSTYVLDCPGGEAAVTIEIIPIVFDS